MILEMRVERAAVCLHQRHDALREDATVFKVGVAYDVTSDLTLRGGYNYGGQPIPASETLFNMIAPGVVEHHATFGGTYAVSENVEMTFAYMHAFESTVEGEDSIIPGMPPRVWAVVRRT